MKIRIFITGGTIDKEYDEIDAGLVFRETHIPEILEKARADLDVETEKLMLLDSLDMTDADRQMIAQKVNDAPEEKIILTHGTDTMVETARAIATLNQNKTVVLTGSMIPYQFDGSDSLFNLGTAVAFVQTLEPGVYIAMNGRYFLYDNCRKNKQLGRFEELSGTSFSGSHLS